MPFLSAITGNDLTKLQTGAYAADLFMAVTPNTVVFEALLSIAYSTPSTAALPYNNVAVGNFAQIKVGMTVLVHTGDITTPKFRGRVRTDATASAVYINETSIALEVGDTITVIDDYDLWARVPGPTGAYDYDASFERIPPAIAGLQSVYVFHQTAGSTSVDFAPSVAAVTKDAGISSYLWTLPASWTITSGSTTSKDITITIPDGAYWCHFEATDSNGAAHTLHVQVFCGDAYTADWTVPISAANWECGLDEGWSGGVTALDDVNDVLDNTRVALFLLDNYDGDTGAINTNIALVGRWSGQVVNLESDDLYGALTDVRFQIDGFATQLATLGLPAVAFDDVNNPTVPGDVEDPTPPRAIWALMTRYSTAGSLMSFDFNSSDNDFIALDLRTESGAALDVMNEIAWAINARLGFAPSGECRLRRDAVYLSSADRDALTTIVSIREDDIASAGVDDSYGMQVGRVVGGAGVYNTTSKRFTGYDGSAPPISYGGGQESRTVNGQVLVADSDADSAREELKGRIGNHLAALNPKPQADVDFVCGAFRCVMPSNADWYLFIVSAESNARGIAYDSSTRWLCSQVNYNFSEFRVDTTARLERETLTTGAKVIAQQIPSASNFALPVLPPLPSYGGPFAPPADYNLPDDLENLDPDDLPAGGISIGAFSPYEPLPPDDAAQEAGQQPGGECLEALSVWGHTGNTYSTTENSTLNVPYVLKISGSLQLTDDGWVLRFNFLDSDGGWDNTGTNRFGTYAAGDGWQAVNGTASRLVSIAFDLGGDFTITGVSMDFDFTAGEYGAVENNAWLIQVRDNGSAVGSESIGSGGVIDGSGQTFNWAGNATGDDVTLTLQTSEDPDEAAYSGAATIKECVIVGTGTPPTGATGGIVVEGDAFYYRYNEEAGGLPQAYPNTAGMLINGGRVTPYPAYQESHEYDIPFTGTGNQIPFQFVDPDGDYSDNQVVPFNARWCFEVVD